MFFVAPPLLRTASLLFDHAEARPPPKCFRSPFFRRSKSPSQRVLADACHRGGSVILTFSPLHPLDIVPPSFLAYFFCRAPASPSLLDESRFEVVCYAAAPCPPLQRQRSDFRSLPLPFLMYCPVVPRISPPSPCTTMGSSFRLFFTPFSQSFAAGSSVLNVVLPP